jgi:hypothetical protein
MHATCPVRLIFLNLISTIIFGESCKLRQKALEKWKCTQNFRRYHFRDLHIDGRIILKRTLKKQGVKVWNEFICLAVTNSRAETISVSFWGMTEVNRLDWVSRSPSECYCIFSKTDSSRYALSYKAGTIYDIRVKYMTIHYCNRWLMSKGSHFYISL